MKLKDMIGVVFKKDEYVNIWEEIVKNYNMELVWNGEASDIPEKYLDRECTIFPFWDRGLILKYQNCLNIEVQKQLEEQNKMANDYDSVAGKVREELVLDELRCSEQSCILAGTEYCVKESCYTCGLHGCRGCAHLKECASEGMLN